MRLLETRPVLPSTLHGSIAMLQKYQPNQRLNIQTRLESPALSCVQTCGPQLQQPLPHNAEAKMLLDRITLCACLLIAAYCGVFAWLVQAVR